MGAAILQGDGKLNIPHAGHHQGQGATCVVLHAVVPLGGKGGGGGAEEDFPLE